MSYWISTGTKEHIYEKMGIWRDYLLKKLVDRERAMGYLQAILDDYYIYAGAVIVKDALDTIVEAQGGIFELAKHTHRDPQVLSKVLSNEDTPLIDALGIVLKALGYQLSIKPLERETPNAESMTPSLFSPKVIFTERPKFFVMKLSNTWLIISIMVMSVGAFYLVVYTLLVVERSNRVVRQQGHTLGDLLTEEQLSQLEDLVNRRKITVGWIDDVFIPRLSDELDHIDWVESGWRDIDLDDLFCSTQHLSKRSDCNGIKIDFPENLEYNKETVNWINKTKTQYTYGEIDGNNR